MRRTAALLTASALMACAGEAAARRENLKTESASIAAAAPSGAQPVDERCPMDVPFTTALLTPTPHGEDITFRSGDGKSDEVRRRVRALAERHNARHGAAPAGLGAGSGSAPAGSRGGRTKGPPPSRASVEELPEGARLVLRANDPADVERLQGEIHASADYIRRRACSMTHEE